MYCPHCDTNSVYICKCRSRHCARHQTAKGGCHVYFQDDTPNHPGIPKSPLFRAKATSSKLDKKGRPKKSTWITQNGKKATVKHRGDYKISKVKGVKPPDPEWYKAAKKNKQQWNKLQKHESRKVQRQRARDTRDRAAYKKKADKKYAAQKAASAKKAAAKKVPPSKGKVKESAQKKGGCLVVAFVPAGIVMWGIVDTISSLFG